MTENTTGYAGLLTRAINRIRADKCKRRAVIRDDLGYAADCEGRTAIDYWRRDSGPHPQGSGIAGDLGAAANRTAIT